MSLKRAARHELQSPEPWRVISTKPRVALRVRPLHRARVVDRHTPQPWVAFAPRRSRRCVVVDRVSSLAARVVVGPGMRAILAFPSSRHGWSPNARLDGVARLRVCAARLAASFARSPVALTVRRRACVKGFHDDANGAETRRRRLDATRDLARSCSASAVRIDARRAARWRSRFARASVAARPRGRVARRVFY